MCVDPKGIKDLPRGKETKSKMGENLLDLTQHMVFSTQSDRKKTEEVSEEATFETQNDPR